jgi:iron complex transport system substrate-binding protein
MLPSFVVSPRLAVLLLSLLVVTVAADDPPERVPIADVVATEIAYMLGAGDRIVAVDATSSYPAEAKEKPQLGYFRNLSAEGILALTPDLLLASPHAGPDVVLDQVRAAGVRIEQTPDMKTLADLPAKVLFVGEALGLEQQAADIGEKLESEIAALAGKRPDLADPPRVLFVISIQDGAPLAAGEGTAPDEVIEAAGGVNVATFDGFKPMNAEAVIAAAPDLLLMTSEHAETLGGAKAVLDRPEFALTPAGEAERSVALPALIILGLGPRTPESIRQLRDALSP